MVGEACLPSNAYYPRTPDYTLCSGVHVCWSEHSDSSFVYGFMILNYGFGTMTATTFDTNRPALFFYSVTFLPPLKINWPHFIYLYCYACLMHSSIIPYFNLPLSPYYPYWYMSALIGFKLIIVYWSFHPGLVEL